MQPCSWRDKSKNTLNVHSARNCRSLACIFNLFSISRSFMVNFKRQFLYLPFLLNYLGLGPMYAMKVDYTALLMEINRIAVFSHL